MDIFRAEAGPPRSVWRREYFTRARVLADPIRGDARAGARQAVRRDLLAGGAPPTAHDSARAIASMWSP